MHDQDVVTPAPSRRTLMRGALWTVPVISLATAAPAYAASCTGNSCPGIGLGNVAGAFGANAANWAYGSTSTGWTYSGAAGWTNGNSVGFATNAGRTAMQAASGPNTASRTVTFTAPITLQATCTYKLTFGKWVYYAGGYVAPTYAVKAGTTTITTGTVNAVTPAAQYVDLGTSTYNVPAGTSGVLTFQVTFSGGSSTTDDYLDIMFDRTSITCS